MKLSRFAILVLLFSGAVSNAQDQDALQERGEAAQKARIKVLQFDPQADLKRQGASTQQARIKLPKDAEVRLQHQGATAQQERVKLSDSAKTNLTKQGNAAQAARVKLPSHAQSSLAKQRTVAQGALSKLPNVKQTDLIQRGELAQAARQTARAPAKQPLQGIRNQAGSGAKTTPPKKVKFNPQVQTKQIPQNPGKKLIAGKPQPLTNPVHGSKGTAKGKSDGGKLGKAALVAGGTAIVGGGIAALEEAKQQRKSGAMTQEQYNKAQATMAVNVVGEAAKLKKFNPSALLLNDVVGTDPLSLGVEGIGDLINGTNNAEQSLRNMDDAWNRSLTKQAFTDPNGAAERVGKDVEQAARDVGKLSGQVGSDMKKAGDTIGREADKAQKAVSKELDKAGKKVDQAAKDAGKFFQGVFGGKKK